jgi:hypothetical protein
MWWKVYADVRPTGGASLMRSASKNDGEAATSYRQRFNIAPTDQHFIITAEFENAGGLGSSIFSTTSTRRSTCSWSMRRRYARTFRPTRKRR